MCVCSSWWRVRAVTFRKIRTTSYTFPAHGTRCYTAEHTTLTPADLRRRTPHNSGGLPSDGPLTLALSLGKILRIFSHFFRTTRHSLLVRALTRVFFHRQRSFFQHSSATLLHVAQAFFTPTDFPPGTTENLPTDLVPPFFQSHKLRFLPRTFT